MKKYLLVCLSLTLTSCMVSTLENFYTPESSIPPRPLNGYDRQSLFPKYFGFDDLPNVTLKPPQIMNSLQTRTSWVAVSKNFEKQYPHFKIDVLAFNQGEGNNSFTWQERLLFSDAVALLSAAINTDTFEQEMYQNSYYHNDSHIKLNTQTVIDGIRSTDISIIFGKKSLGSGVLAEATVGGVGHTIWFRNDVNYIFYNISQLAIILGHEITHNMGYLHSSNVPYGVHMPIAKAIQQMTGEDVSTFIKHTPHKEDEFLYRVRDITKIQQSSVPQKTIQDTYTLDDINNLFQ